MSLIATSGGDALILARAPERAEATWEAGATPPTAEVVLATGLAVPVLRLEGICLSFDGITALDGIDLAVGDDEIRAIIGPNGAGKSFRGAVGDLAAVVENRDPVGHADVVLHPDRRADRWWR
ncbi:hypothetical protein FBZ93_1226 [Bradyrhizobium macuxiense]|uniref:ABC transporter domain-containing protein n=1 Tax=Bradyrhizobium macuxiense TaxID=1755647 RepID=A0A560KVJ1_9BRAD|nr:hypothetical protein FBZ93_1226 [Bradyrhizobium macuxiense]